MTSSMHMHATRDQHGEVAADVQSQFKSMQSEQLVPAATVTRL